METKTFLGIDMLIKQVSKNIESFVNKVPDTDEESKQIQNISKKIRLAISGDFASRETIIEYIKNLVTKDFYLYKIDKDDKLMEYVVEKVRVTEENIDDIINFETEIKLTSRDKFEIILYKYIKKYDKDAIEYIKEKYSYMSLKYGEIYTNKRYEYTKEDIDDMYKLEKYNLEYEEKLDIIAMRIYSEIYGLSEIDMLTYLNINEVGISGDYVYCWSGEKIRLNFFNLTNKKVELIQNKAIQFDNSAKQLDNSNPEVLTHRINDSRVTVVQEPYSTDRHISIRIFNQKKSDIQELYNVEKQRKLITTLVKTGESIIFQGGLGTGKTTTMSTLIGVLDDNLHIGTIEDYFEQHNRKKYKNKRIVELQKTEDKSLIDAVKTLLRMSIDVADVGEIRDGEALFSYIQLLQSVSVGAWCTTHIVNPETTVPRLKNMLMGTGLYSSENSAVMDIINYVNCIFQHEIINGKRMISKIVEIIPIENEICHDDISIDKDIKYLEKLYIYQQLQNNSNNMYKLNYIMRADEDGNLKFDNYPSERMVKKAKKDKETFKYMKELIFMISEETGKLLPTNLEELIIG